jgi:N-methylhydantoinase B
VLFEGGGSSLAQGTLSVPSFTGTAPPTLRHMLHRFPPEALQPGDVLITNDPWMGTGHVYDANVMRPIFRRDRLVGYSMSITHLPDIGGPGYSTVVREVHEEGLWLPIVKLMKAGRLNEELIEIIRANVRLEDMVVGDLMASITCNEVAGRLLLELMDEYGLEDLAELSGAIIAATEQAMRARLRSIPDGTYRNRIQIEGVDEPIALACAVTVEGDRVHLDFDGTGPSVGRGINVPLCYTRAFTNYSIKCLTIPEVPNNEGAANPISLSAPPGCILNALPPAATGGRHIIGHYVTPLIFGALAEVLPDRVQADCGMLTQFNFQGTNREGRGISSIFFAAGGYGALDGMDGWPATPGPSNMIGTPVEIWENETGTTILRKAILPDTGGAGAFRGGPGQEIAIRNDTGHPLEVSTFAGRTEFASVGYRGGADGALRRHEINGRPVHPKGRYVLQPGDVIGTREAGGGGFGEARLRSPERVLADLRDGYVTIEGARRDYGVEVDLKAGRAWRKM